MRKVNFLIKNINLIIEYQKMCKLPVKKRKIRKNVIK